MASMGFDKDTLVELMSLVDRHQDDIKEADYVKMCNVMRYLHQKFQEPERPTHQTSPPSPQTQSSVRYTELQLAELRVQGILTAIRQSQARSPVVLNIHRQKVIGELTEECFRGPRGGMKKLRGVEITNRISLLISSGLIFDEAHFENLAVIKAREDARAHIRRLRVLLNESRTQLEILRRARNAVQTDN